MDARRSEPRRILVKRPFDFAISTGGATNMQVYQPRTANVGTILGGYAERGPASLLDFAPESNGAVVYVAEGYPQAKQTVVPYYHSQMKRQLISRPTVAVPLQIPTPFNRTVVRGSMVRATTVPLTKTTPLAGVATSPKMRRVRKTPRDFRLLGTSEKQSPFVELSQDSFLNRSVRIELAMRSRDKVEQTPKKEEAFFTEYPALKEILFDNMQMYYFILYNRRECSDLGSNPLEKLHTFRKKIVQELLEAAKKNGYPVEQDSLLEKQVTGWYKTKMNDTVAELEGFSVNRELEDLLRDIIKKVKASKDYQARGDGARDDSVQTESESMPGSPPTTTEAENKRRHVHVSDDSDQSTESQSTSTGEPSPKRARGADEMSVPVIGSSAARQGAVVDLTDTSDNQVDSQATSEDEATVMTHKHSNVSDVPKATSCEEKNEKTTGCCGLEILWLAHEIQLKEASSR